MTMDVVGILREDPTREYARLSHSDDFVFLRLWLRWYCYEVPGTETYT